ncbi:hypothetical protein, partial [Nocardia salmonicida]|uniref:hypothetical protein n=1 Tax=Nocardia salmonicida TaxID=53431 RepID=UPI003651166B
GKQSKKCVNSVYADGGSGTTDKTRDCGVPHTPRPPLTRRLLGIARTRFRRNRVRTWSLAHICTHELPVR